MLTHGVTVPNEIIESKNLQSLTFSFSLRQKVKKSMNNGHADDDYKVTGLKFAG